MVYIINYYSGEEMNIIPQEIAHKSILDSENITNRQSNQNNNENNHNNNNGILHTIYLDAPQNENSNNQTPADLKSLSVLFSTFRDPEATIKQPLIANVEAPQTIVKSLKFPDGNRICFFCKKVVEEICIQLTEVDRICSNCLINILLSKIDKFPESELKILHGRAVFSIPGKHSMLTLSFGDCYAKLPLSKREEYKKRIKNKSNFLIQEVNSKCMVCKSLLNKKNAMELEVDGKYNENQFVFQDINYSNNNHFVCEKCYLPWLRLTRSNQLKDIAVLRCEICNIDHSCTNKSKDKCLIF